MKTNHLKFALNIRLPRDGTLPEWVELIPAGEHVIGRDNRKWINPAPDDIVDAFYENRADLPIDWEHATEKKAPKGEPAPAAGWIKEMETRDGAVWGRTEWTDKGADDVKNKRYRYLSPVIIFLKKNRRIVGIDSAGLTNKPNLRLAALNQAEKPQNNPQPKETGMEFLKALCRLLELAEDTTEDQALEQVKALKGDLATAQNRARHCRGHRPERQRPEPG